MKTNHIKECIKHDVFLKTTNFSSKDLSKFDKSI